MINYPDTSHVHTGSLDWLRCSICNPTPENLKRDEENMIYVYECKCGEQFVSRKKRKKKKQLCKGCGSTFNNSW